MKLGPVTKIDKRNKTTSKKIDIDVMSKKCDAIDIFRILANLEQSGGQIPETESAKVLFSVIVIFFLAKN